MKVARKFAFAAPLLLLLLPAPSGLAAQNTAAAGKLQQVLAQLDSSAKKFRSASADFEFKNIQTVPVPDTDIMTGKVYYQHQGGGLRVAAHITQHNGQPYESVYTYNNGVFQLYQKNLNQVTKYQNAANLAGYVSLGFGATGKELQDQFQITYVGQETIDGVKTYKLDLVFKNDKARATIPKVTMWIDPVRDVSLKQVFDEGQGLSRIATYTHIEMNHSIASSEFTFKTNKKTQFTTQ